MANSGVRVQDQVVQLFQDMKTKKTSQFSLFNLTEDKKEIEVSRTGEKNCDFQTFVNILKETGPTYAVYDFEYTNKDGVTKRTLFFVYWCPDNTGIKQKMLMSTSKDALKKKLNGFQHEVQMTDFDDLCETTFLEKVKDYKP